MPRLPQPNLRLTQGVVQVNVNGFELSPDALARVRMHQFRVFPGAAISRGAVTSRGHDRAAISRGAVTSRGHDRAQPANSGSRGSGSVGTAASASNDDDDAKGFAAIVERALLAHARSQLIRPKLAGLPWAIANLRDMPVILWAQFEKQPWRRQCSLRRHTQCQWHWRLSWQPRPVAASAALALAWLAALAAST